MSLFRKKPKPEVVPTHMNPWIARVAHVDVSRFTHPPAPLAGNVEEFEIEFQTPTKPLVPRNLKEELRRTSHFTDSQAALFQDIGKILNDELPAEVQAPARVMSLKPPSIPPLVVPQTYNGVELDEEPLDLVDVVE